MELRWETSLISLILYLSIFFLIINLSFSISSDFYTPRKCTDIWEQSCDLSTLNDAFNSSWNGTHNLGCDGEQSEGLGSGQDVQEVYLNATSVKFGDAINATCQFEVGQYLGKYSTTWMFYYNGSEGGWMTLGNWTDTEASLTVKNHSVVFKPNNTEGTHYIRCTLRQNVAPKNFCANWTGEADYGIRDNDDVNFTVTDKLKYDNWALINFTTGATIPDGANATRNDKINASAHWNKDLDKALIRHNGTGSPSDHWFSPSGNWTNYTLDLSNDTEFSKVGLINVSYIWANDTYGLDNYTSPSHYFYLYGESNVSQITLNDSYIYNESSIQISCKVVDANSNLGIPNYNVSFYENDNYLDTTTTNESGWADYSHTVYANTIPSSINLKCNITDYTEGYYTASSENSKNTSTQLSELEVQAFADPVSITFGNNVEITANITGNASTITSVQANIAYKNISDGKLVQTPTTKDLTFKQSYSSTSYLYNLTYTPPNSGDYSVNITVNAEKEKWNTTNFAVSFGTPTISFISPNYRIMTNQTFNFTVNITSTTGDIWYTNLTIAITNATRINVSTGQSYSLTNLYNISNGMSDTMTWTLKSSYSGLTRIKLNVTPQNGSFATDDSIHDVLYPIVEAPTPTNVNVNETITTKIIGNVTGIDSINFSVSIPYTSDIINFSSYYVRSETESQCTGETLASGRLTLKPPYGNASCTPVIDGCEDTIDNTTSSFMTLGAGAELIIKLDSEQTVERILLYWRNYTALSGPGNATIYYNDSGTWTTISELSELTSPNTIGYTNITGFTPFKTNAFKMTHVGDVINNVYEFEAYGIPGKVGLCYVYEYNFSDVIKSGTYYFNFTTRTKDSTVKQSSSFFADYGYPQIEIDADSLMYKTVDSKYNATIIAYNGDLRNLTVNLTISNTSVVQNQTPTETLLRNISEILSGDQVTVIFNLTAMNDGRTNTTVWVNSTTNEGYYNQSGLFPINVTSEAGDPPKVANFWFSYLDTDTDKTNLFTAFTIHANVSDDIQMGEVLANITYPSPGDENFNLTFETGDKEPGWHIWNYTFGTHDDLNATGNYTVMIIARDFGGKENVSGEYGGYPKYMTFEVFDDYSLNLTSEHDLYMRGENVTVQALGVNNKVAENVNWTVNITKIDETQTENNLTTTYNYRIKSNDPEGNYSIFVINATKDGNHGNGTWYFNVSRNFSVSVNVENSASRDVLLFIDVDLYNARGNSHTSSVDANITCQNKSEVYLTYPLTFTDGHSDFDGICATPEGYKTKYHITINVSDQYNNYGFYNNTFTTEEQEVITPPSTGDGGTPPSPGPTCTPEAEYEIDCGDEKDNDCDRATDCADPDCFEFPACIEKIPDFIFNMTTEIEIKQGEDGKVGGTMKNTGNVRLLLKSSVDIEKSCCLIEIPSSFTVPQKTTKGFNATIHVNTSTPPGEYVLNFKLNYLALQNSQPVKVIVKENEIISYILKTMTSELTRIISEINEYKDVGVDVSHLEYRIDNIQNLIQNAKEAVTQDNLELLKQYNDEIRLDVEYINAEKDRLAFQKLIYENKWNITYGLIIGIVSAYLIIQVIVPFVRLSHEIVKLTFDKTALTQSRTKAEKQYFLRKIDEQTFRRIATSKHSQILKLSSTIDLKKQQRIDLLKKRLNPLSVGEYIKKKLSKKHL